MPLCPAAMPSCQATKFFQILRPRGLRVYSSQLGNTVWNQVSTVALNWKAPPVRFGSYFAGSDYDLFVSLLMAHFSRARIVAL